MSYCWTHAKHEHITCGEIAEARERWPDLKELVQWVGLSPSWYDLGCRGCWDIIGPGMPAVECGVGAFHMRCFEAITETRPWTAHDRLDAIRNILYPAGDRDHQWNADTLDAIAAVIDW
jgi:hypothetical protein